MLLDIGPPMLAKSLKSDYPALLPLSHVSNLSQRPDDKRPPIGIFASSINTDDRNPTCPISFCPSPDSPHLNTGTAPAAEADDWCPDPPEAQYIAPSVAAPAEPVSMGEASCCQPTAICQIHPRPAVVLRSGPSPIHRIFLYMLWPLGFELAPALALRLSLFPCCFVNELHCLAHPSGHLLWRCRRRLCCRQIG